MQIHTPNAHQQGMLKKAGIPGITINAMMAKEMMAPAPAVNGEISSGSFGANPLVTTANAPAQVKK